MSAARGAVGTSQIARPVRVTVIKLGGHAMEEATSRRRLLEETARLSELGLNPVIVHGAGPQIDAALEREGVRSSFVQGLRVTDAKTLVIAESVLLSVGKAIVGELESLGASAVSISGRDAATFKAVKKQAAAGIGGYEDVVDLGFVGEVRAVDTSLVDAAIAAGLIPVVSPISSDGNGGALNVNADEAAAALAVAMGAERFILMTNVAGVKDADGTVLSTLSVTEASKLLTSGAANGGMVPKLAAAIQVVEAGVGRVVITSGGGESPLFDALAGKNGGTTVVGRWSQ